MEKSSKVNENNTGDKYLPDIRHQRDIDDSDHIYFGTKPEGYERVANQHMGKHFQVRIHRLIAVANWGFDSVKNKIVHHKNNIPWDNRHENLELMTQSMHVKQHAKSGKYGRQKLTNEIVAELRRNYEGEKTFEEISKDYPIGPSSIRDAIRGRTWEWVDEPPVEKQDDRNPAAKLTKKDVREIRDKYKPYKTTQKDLANDYNVSVPTVKNIVQGRSWKNV